jgi:hypothetical protein
MTEKRYVLCRPVSGLNDTLCQFEICREYAERTGRILVVDGRLSAGVLTEFGDYFQMKGDQHIFHMTSPELPNLESLDCYPPEVFGRIFTLNRIGHPDPNQRATSNLVDSETMAPLRFDPEQDYPQRLLLRQQWGGSTQSYRALKHLSLVPSLATRVRSAIEGLPAGYAALHLRNTDYRTDIASVVHAMRDKVTGRDLLVCSDDATAFDQVREGLPATRVHRLTVPAFDDGKPLHISAKSHGAAVRRRVATNAIVDLCALAGATTLFTAHLTGHNTMLKPKKSGFSRLAERLGGEKQRLRLFLGPVGRGLLRGIDTGELITIEG